MANTDRADFIKQRGFYTGVWMLGIRISWKCPHRHPSFEEARQCATDRHADQLLEWYDEIQEEEGAA